MSSPAGCTAVNPPCMLQDLEAAVSEAFPAASQQQPEPAPQPPAPLEAAGKLWNKDAELAEARERAEWHEVMSRRQTDVSEKLQVRLSPCNASAQAGMQQQSVPDAGSLAGNRLHARCSAAGLCAAAPWCPAAGCHLQAGPADHSQPLLPCHREHCQAQLCPPACRTDES